MLSLGLTTKQYAKLINIPYEVVKDVIYGKKGEYSMEIGNLLRKDMFKKHQEIEDNFEQAKIDALQIKQQEPQDVIIDYKKWYDEEYDKYMIREKVKSGTTTEFLKKYKIKIKGKTPSRWHNWSILTKNENELSHVKPEIIKEYAKQLYEIFNGNEQKYLNENYDKLKVKKSKKLPIKLNQTDSDKRRVNKTGIEFDWYNSFDFNDYMEKNNVTRGELAREVGIEYSVMTKAILKTYASVNTVKILYNYFNKTNISENSEPVELKSEQIIIPAMNFVPVENLPIVEEIDNYSLLRKILVDRLTDEEKELIKIFGGKID